jgi:hypothetical protein
LKSNDFSEISHEIIAAKNDVIGILKESLQSKDNDVVQLRAVISDLTQQLQTTTKQNAWLTSLLVAPQHETEPVRSAKASDISDFIAEITDEDVHDEMQPHEDDGREPTDQSAGEAMSGDSESDRE